jgi:hypothetical protein
MVTPPETVEQPLAEAPGDQNRLRIILLAVLAGVIVLGLVYFLFLRGAPVEEPGALPPPEVPVEETVEPIEEEEDADDEPLETFDVFAAKDPFEPAIDEDGEEIDSDDDDDDDDESDDDDDDGDSVDGDTFEGDPDDGGGGTASGGGRRSVGGHRVRVVDVYPRGGRAQIQVDSTVWEVREGEEFADNFELLSASGECATMLFGDDEFTLCEGEEILK